MSPLQTWTSSVLFKRVIYIDSENPLWKKKVDIVILKYLAAAVTTVL